MLAAAVMLCASVGVVSCGSPDPKPDPVAQQFVTAVQAADYAKAASFTTVPAATLGAPYQQLLTAHQGGQGRDLARRRDGRRDQEEGQRAVPDHRHARGFRAVVLARDPAARTGRARPGRSAGRRRWSTLSWWLASRSRSPRRSALGYGRQVLGAGGQVLVGIADVYAIGITPGKMTDPTGEIATLAALLKPQGITVEGLTAKYTAGLAHPAQKIPIISLRELDFAPIEPKLLPLPGVPYTRVSASIAESPTFAHALLGRVSAVTAEELKTLGAGYTATSQVGQSASKRLTNQGLPALPTLRLCLSVLTARQSATRSTTFPGVAGQPVTLTIDPKVQAAAETALGTVDSPVGDVTSLVAIRPSTGEVLAVANRPSASSFDAGAGGPAAARVDVQGRGQ